MKMPGWMTQRIIRDSIRSRRETNLARRSSKVIAKWATAGVFMLLAAGTALAQTSTAIVPNKPTQTDAQIGFQRRPQLTLEEQLAQSEGIVGRMEQTASVMRKQLEDARKARDVVKILCLNDKLSQMDVAVRSARERRTALQAAALRRDIELSNHEFTILTVLKQRAEQLVAEANQCIGQESAFVGQTQVTTQVDPTVPSGDTTQQPGYEIITPPPPCATCSL